MNPVDDFDQWIRDDFVALNTGLEEAYFSARTQILYDDPVLTRTTRRLLRDGAGLVRAIADDRTAVPDDPQRRYDLLGTVGFYLGACRRHEADGGAEAAGLLAPAHALARRLGSSLGVAPRFVFAHQSLHNLAERDAVRTFTSLKDENAFVVHNGLAVLAYERTAEALRRIPSMGASGPLTTYLLEQALAGLDDVLEFSRTLSETVDVDRFFFNIRPYFKPYRVGGETYRGANAGDFAAINTIDVLLGLCSPHDSFYQGVLTEKYPYVPPADQAALRTLASTGPLLDVFLREAEDAPSAPGLRRNTELFLTICRRHGAANSFHHNRLVKPYLVEPAKDAPPERQDDLTASGPPLDMVVDMLARLSDLRAARSRPGLTTARRALDRLRACAAMDAP